MHGQTNIKYSTYLRAVHNRKFAFTIRFTLNLDSLFDSLRIIHRYLKQYTF